MTTATYLATATAINTALSTAGITTLTFSNVTAITINAVLYPNLLSYIGYYLESDTLKVHSIIATELAKTGEWSSVKSPNRIVTPPSNPADDHYLTINGYHISNTDLSATTVADKQFKTDVEAATKLLSTTIQNKARPGGFVNITSETVAFTVVESPTGTKTINASVVLVVVKP
jgi:hypothetical protein